MGHSTLIIIDFLLASYLFTSQLDFPEKINKHEARITRSYFPSKFLENPF